MSDCLHRNNEVVLFFYIVRMYGWDTKAYGTIRLSIDGRNILQNTYRYHVAGHQSILIQILYVQSWPRFMYKCKNNIIIFYNYS